MASAHEFIQPTSVGWGSNQMSAKRPLSVRVLAYLQGCIDTNLIKVDDILLASTVSG
jgi:hypothetical protein